MTVRPLLALLLVGAFAGAALAACPGMRMAMKPDVVASADGATTNPAQPPRSTRAD